MMTKIGLEKVLYVSRSIITVALLCILSACTSNTFIPYEAAPDLLNQRLLYQLDTEAEEKTVRLLLVLEHYPEHVRFVGINAAGMTNFTLQRDYSGDKIKTAALTKLQFKPAQLLDEILTANASSIAKHLQINTTGQQLLLELIAKETIE